MYNFKREDFVGLDTCWGIPQGNSICRGKAISEQIKEFKIDSLGKNIIKHSNGGYLSKTRLSLDGSTDSYYSGYMAYPTKEDALDSLESAYLIQQIKSSNFTNLTHQQIKSIYNMLKV